MYFKYRDRPFDSIQDLSFRFGHLKEGFELELVSKELNHFGVIADLFRQIRGHSSRFVLFCKMATK